MKSKAPTVMILGILGMAHSMVTQGQVMQTISKIGDLAGGEKKIKIAGPGEMPQ